MLQIPEGVFLTGPAAAFTEMPVDGAAATSFSGCRGVDMRSDKFAKWLEFAGRALLGITFVYWGGRKLVDVLGLGDPDAAWGLYMQSVGIPAILLPLVILTELGGGLLLMAGWRTRTAAFLLAGFCVLANYFFHMRWALPPPAGHFN